MSRGVKCGNGQHGIHMETWKEKLKNTLSEV